MLLLDTVAAHIGQNRVWRFRQKKNCHQFKSQEKKLHWSRIFFCQVFTLNIQKSFFLLIANKQAMLLINIYSKTEAKKWQWLIGHFKLQRRWWDLFNKLNTFITKPRVQLIFSRNNPRFPFKILSFEFPQASWTRRNHRKTLFKCHSTRQAYKVKRSSQLIDCCLNALMKFIEKVKISLQRCFETEGLENLREEPHDVAKFT